MNSRTRVLIAVAICLAVKLVSTTGARAQQDPLSKPFRQWTKTEATRILNDSPWAVTQEARIDFSKQFRHIAGAPITDSGHPGAETTGANIAVDYRVTLRLRSALPIRQALLRLKQLDSKYEKMSEKGRTAFDTKNKGVLDCPACALNYVITISCKSQNYPGADALYDGLKGATLPGLKPYVHILNDRGDQRELVHFVPPKAPEEEAVFFFPRFDNEDRPLITSRDKKLIFRFSDNNAKAITNFELDVSSLMFKGEIAF